MEWIGWISSLILVATLLKQVHKQWTEHNAEGVSIWLYVGQISSQTGFIIYSYLLKNWVFMFTNAVLLIVSMLGLYSLNKFRTKNLHRFKE